MNKMSPFSRLASKKLVGISNVYREPKQAASAALHASLLAEGISGVLAVSSEKISGQDYYNVKIPSDYPKSKLDSVLVGKGDSLERRGTKYVHRVKIPAISLRREIQEVVAPYQAVADIEVYRKPEQAASAALHTSLISAGVEGVFTVSSELKDGEQHYMVLVASDFSDDKLKAVTHDGAELSVDSENQYTRRIRIPASSLKPEVRGGIAPFKRILGRGLGPVKKESADKSNKASPKKGRWVSRCLRRLSPRHG